MRVLDKCKKMNASFHVKHVLLKIIHSLVSKDDDASINLALEIAEQFKDPESKLYLYSHIIRVIACALIKMRHAFDFAEKLASQVDAITALIIRCSIIYEHNESVIPFLRSQMEQHPSLTKWNHIQELINWRIALVDRYTIEDCISIALFHERSEEDDNEFLRLISNACKNLCSKIKDPVEKRNVMFKFSEGIMMRGGIHAFRHPLVFSQDLWKNLD